MIDADALADVATGLAEAAGSLLVEYSGSRDLEVETKTSATDPVSEADRAAERLIIDGISTSRPDDGIVGEEAAGNRTGSTGLRWVVDPLDGTVNFLYGIPAWCVSIACEDDEGPLVGVVHDPNRGETFVARRGRGTTCNSTPVCTSQVETLAQALVATGFSYGPDVRAVQGRWAADLLGEARDIRRFGAAALDLAWTAAGRFDAFYEFGLNHWDYAAGVLLVEEAGGRSTRVPVTVGETSDAIVIAGGVAIHAELARWIDEHAVHGLRER
jgi:myo-inositol-1(or 4)-monophosphatase